LSLGRYGADDPRTRKVSLEVTVDRWVSDALGKIRSKKSVSSLVNGLLGTVIRQFDPGPSAPMVYDLVALLARHRKLAEATGDAEALAAISQLHSELKPYIDLAEAEPRQDDQPTSMKPREPRDDRTFLLQGAWNPAFGPPPPTRDRRDYYWYAVPVLCHGAPMVYSGQGSGWECTMCGRLIRDT